MSRPPLSLDSGAMHVWHFDHVSASPEDLSYYERQLNESEFARMKRFRFEKDQRCYAVSHGVLRSVLSMYGDSAPEAWQFEEGEKGKPFIVESQRQSLYFSLSHTREKGLIGVSRNPMVGVDIEDSSRKTDPLGLSERFFNSAEFKEIAEQGSNQINERFFRIWTLKEAYVKACGQGLSLSLKTFALSLQGKQIVLADDNHYVDDGAQWQFHSYFGKDGFTSGLATRQRAKLAVRHFHLIAPGQYEKKDDQADFTTTMDLS